MRRWLGSRWLHNFELRGDVICPGKSAQSTQPLKRGILTSPSHSCFDVGAEDQSRAQLYRWTAALSPCVTFWLARNNRKRIAWGLTGRLKWEQAWAASGGAERTFPLFWCRGRERRTRLLRDQLKTVSPGYSRWADSQSLASLFSSPCPAGCANPTQVGDGVP